MSAGGSIAVAGMCLLLSVNLLSARTHRVPVEYATIEAAFMAVDDGDTVLVAPGTYAEELTAPPFRFWLLGDVPLDTGAFERPVIDPSTLSNPQARRCLTVPAACELTVERMAFHNRATMYPRAGTHVSGGIVVNADFPATFRHCAFDSVYRAIVHDDQSAALHLVVEDCRFTNATRIQIRGWSGGFTGRATVRRCYFHSRSSVSEMIIGKDSSLVEDCFFTGPYSGGAVHLNGSGTLIRNCLIASIDTCLDYPALSVDRYGRTVLLDNVIQDVNFVNTPAVRVTYLSSGDSAASLVRGNVLHGNTARGLTGSTGMRLNTNTLSHPPVSAILEGNRFTDCREDSGTHGSALTLLLGVQLTDNHFGGLQPRTVPVIYNIPDFVGPPSQMRECRFAAGEYALWSPSRSVDAVWNYWGHPSGPHNAVHNPEGQGAQVSDRVLFSPWSPDTSFLAVPGQGVPLPKEFVFEAYPNPFNGAVRLTLTPVEAGIVAVELYDLLGRRVAEVWKGPLTFRKDITFDADELASGVYFARVTDVISRKPLAAAKLVLLK